MFLRQRYESCDLLGHMAETIFRRCSGLRDHWPGWGWHKPFCRILSHTGTIWNGFIFSGLRRFRSGCIKCIKLKSRTQKLLQEGHWKHKSQQESFVCCYAMLCNALQCYAMLCNVMALHMISCSQKRFIVWKSVMVSTDFSASLHKIRSASEIRSAPGRKHWFLVWSLPQELKAQPDSIDEARNQEIWEQKKWHVRLTKVRCVHHLPRDSLLFPWWPWCPTGEVDDVALFVELASERILVSRRWIDCHSLPFIAIDCHCLFPVRIVPLHQEIHKRPWEAMTGWETARTHDLKVWRACRTHRPKIHTNSQPHLYVMHCLFSSLSLSDMLEPIID